MRQCAKVLDGTTLKAKLRQGLLVAQDALYHRKCKLDLYRKADDKQQAYNTGVQTQLHGIVFSEIISFIEEAFNTSGEAVRLFTLPDLNKVYCETLESLGLQIEDRIHKQWILVRFEDLREYREGRKFILAFAENIGDIRLPDSSPTDAHPRTQPRQTVALQDSSPTDNSPTGHWPEG